MMYGICVFLVIIRACHYILFFVAALSITTCCFSCSCNIWWTIKLVQFLIIPYSSFSCTSQYILHKTFLRKLRSHSCSICINVCVLLLYSRASLTGFCTSWPYTELNIQSTIVMYYSPVLFFLFPVTCIVCSFPFVSFQSHCTIWCHHCFLYVLWSPSYVYSMAAFTGKNKEHYFQTDLATVQTNVSKHLLGFHRNLYPTLGV